MMRSLFARSLLLVSTPLCLTLVACGDSGTSNAELPFGGAGGDAGSSAAGSSGSSQGGSAGSANGGSAGSGNGGSGNGGSGNGGSGGSGNGGSGGSGNGGSGNGGSGAGTQDAGIPDVAFTYDAPVIVEEACAATRIEADPIPLDMYIVLDDSGSMGSDCSVGSSTSSKWCSAVQALWGFFNAPTSVGMGVALNYFNNGYSCSSSAGLTNPPGGGSVALNTLPAHLSALQTSLNNAGPNGITPTIASLRSIASFTAANQRAGRQMIGILITDGLPQTCVTDNTSLRNIAVNHFNATGIPTFMVGMTGASFAGIENWANGSGSPAHTNYCGSGLSNPCYSYDVGNGDPTVFINTLKDIQKAAIGCTFNIPTPPTGIPDITKIKVIYSSGGNSETLVRVTDQTQCGGSPGTGWYFNDNANPTQILLCPDACTRVSGDQNAQIDVEIPCLGS